MRLPLTPLSVVERCSIDDLQDGVSSLVVVPFALRCFNYVPTTPPSEATLTADDEIPQRNYFSPKDEASHSTSSSYDSDSDVDEDNVSKDESDVLVTEIECTTGMR